MPTPRLEDDEVLRRIECWQRNHRQRHKAAAELGISKPTLDKTIKVAAERGLFLDDKPAMRTTHRDGILITPDACAFSLSMSPTFGASAFTSAPSWMRKPTDWQWTTSNVSRSSR